MGESQDIVLASKGGQTTRVIAILNKDPLMYRTASWCSGFLERQGFKAKPAISAKPGKGSFPIWILETKESCPIAKSYAVDVSKLDTGRADAFILKVFKKNNRPIVVIVGRNIQGVRSGVARLVALIKNNGDTLTVSETSEYRTPFFPIRRLMVAPTGRIAQGTECCKKFGLPESCAVWKDTLWTNWTDDRINKYAEQLWLYGFNSIELCEIRGYRGVFSDDDLKNNITPKLRTFMKAVRDNGMQVSQFIWGQSLFVEGENLCWNSPEERPTMEKEYHRLAQTYGDLVDHIVVHVGDPGGCHRNGCDAYKTTQEIASFLLQEYRKVNPKVTVTLSTWANQNFWNGRPGDKFLDESHSPKEIGIALHRWYDPDKAKLITDSDRNLDIWGWYLSDMEMNFDMQLFMRRLDAYYANLPEDASKQVRAVSTEICFHGWPQIINAYVTAQKMWSPKRSLQDIEREFCAATFGDKNADAMVKVYDACEAYVHPERYYAFIPRTDCLPVVFGTPEYNKQLSEALNAMKTVRLDTIDQPKFTQSTPPKALQEYLELNLKLIAVFSNAQLKIDEAKAAGADSASLQKIANDAIASAASYAVDPDYPVLSKALRKSILDSDGKQVTK